MGGLQYYCKLGASCTHLLFLQTYAACIVAQKSVVVRTVGPFLGN